MNDVLFAFLLTLLAGLSTGLGGAVALFARRTKPNFLGLCLSFSAGVMLYISFVEIFSKADESLSELWGEDRGFLFGTLAFFAGVGLIALINRFIPCRAAQVENDEKDLNRMGLMSALSIAIHNFPEGLITFMAALQDPALGVAMAIAVAIHNIPEGVAIAAPLYYATGSRAKALLFSIASGLTEPLGAVAAYFLLARVFSEGMFGLVFAASGGMMVFIAIQLLPVAEAFGGRRRVIKGVFAGMGVMALSLILI